MKFEASTALITGAAGGIGSSLARRLAAAGMNLVLTDLDAAALESLAEQLIRHRVRVRAITADITTRAGREKLVTVARQAGVNVLINVAGVNPFGLVENQSCEEIERALTINTIAPILLCRALLPALSARPEAHIVNIGSTFGALGFPGFSVYSATKFAMRGFTEALRRELSASQIRVHYVAPRATRTALTTDAVRALNEELKIGMDSPETVARAIERSLRRGHRETYLGWPERLFVLVNAVLPRLVDRSLGRQLAVIQRHAATTPPDSARQAPSRPAYDC